MVVGSTIGTLGSVSAGVTVANCSSPPTRPTCGGSRTSQVALRSSWQWAEYPEMYEVQQTFWKQGEPNIYPNYDDVCVAMSKSSPEWISSLCSAVNLIVCARDVQHDKSPVFCASNEQQQRELSCTQGTTITIDYASYGSTTGTTCNGQARRYDCENVHSLQTIVNFSQCRALNYTPSAAQLQVVDLPCQNSASWICSSAPSSATIIRPLQRYNSTDTTRPTVAPPKREEATESAFPDIWCPATKWKSLEFQRTRACQTATVNCPDPENVIGTVTWRCDCETGKWVGTQPNTTGCTHKWVGELRTRVQNGDPAEQLSTSLNEQLGITLKSQLYGGDITGSVGASADMVALARSQFAQLFDTAEKQSRSANFTKNLGGAGDHLFSSPAQLVWSGLDPEEKVSIAAKLMSVLQDSSLLWADYFSKSEEDLKYTEWESSISKTQQSVMQSPMVAMSPAAFSGAADAAATPTVDDGSIKVAYFIFTALGDLLVSSEHEVINSQVIGAAVNDAQRSVPLENNATFHFPHLRSDGVSNARCVYWDIHRGAWSQDGCFLVSTSATETTCSCNHLTSFAILMDVSGNALDVVSSIGCAFSIVCLALSLLVFTCFRSLYGLRNTIHRNLCLCLLIGNLVFVIGIDRTGNKTGCSVVALILHYFFLAAFFWMLIEGYQLYMMLIQVFEPSNRRMILMVCLAYGTPLVIVIISAAVRWKDYGTDSYCWINTASPTIWAFVAPVIVVIAANIGFLLIALRVVLSVRRSDKPRSQRVFGWLKGSATLLCLLGITWLFGFLTAVKGSGSTLAFAWIFTILNCTQGVFIFVLHVLLNDKVRAVIGKWLRSGSSSAAADYNSRTWFSSGQRVINMLRGNTTPNTASTDDTKAGVVGSSSATLSPGKTDELLRRLSASASDSLRDKGMAYRPSRDAAPKPIVLASRVDGIEKSSSTDTSDPRVSVELDADLPADTRPPVQRRKFPLGAHPSERGSKGHYGPKFRNSREVNDVDEAATTAPSSAESAFALASRSSTYIDHF
ncbi:unnamed protein product, partial [Mesorhabditis spiculigera]